MFHLNTGLLSTLRVGTCALGFLLFVSLALSGCEQVRQGPGKKDVEAAIHGMIGDATGIQLPPGYKLAMVSVKGCVWQDSPEGHVCDIVLVSSEMPVIGAISIPVRLRFAKRSGQWKGFLN